MHSLLKLKFLPICGEEDGGLGLVVNTNEYNYYAHNSTHQNCFNVTNTSSAAYVSPPPGSNHTAAELDTAVTYAAVYIAFAATFLIVFTTAVYKPLIDTIIACIKWGPRKWDARKVRISEQATLADLEARYEARHPLVATSLAGDKYRLAKGWGAAGADLHAMLAASNIDDSSASVFVSLPRGEH